MGLLFYDVSENLDNLKNYLEILDQDYPEMRIVLVLNKIDLQPERN